MSITIIKITAQNPIKKKYGLVGFFGNNIMYRLRYVDKNLGNSVHKSLIAQGYNSCKYENDWAIELEILAPKENKVLLSAMINRLKCNITRDTLVLKNLKITVQLEFPNLF